MRHITGNIKEQVEDFHTFKDYLDLRLPKEAFLAMMQKSFSTSMMTKTAMPHPSGDLYYVNGGTTNTAPFYVIVFVEHPGEPLIDTSSRPSRDGERLLNDLASVVRFYGDLDHFRSIRIKTPSYFRLEEDPISHMELVVLTCRSSHADLDYFEQLEDVIKERIPGFVTGKPSWTGWKSRHRESVKPATRQPTFSISIRSYDHLLDQLTYDLLDQFPFKEQATILAIYEDLRRRNTHISRMVVNPIYLMEICLLLLDPDMHARVFESALLEDALDENLLITAIRKTGDQGLLASFLQRQGMPEEAQRLASLKLEYLSNGISGAVSNEDLFRSWQTSVTILDSIREPGELQRFRSAFEKVFGHAPYEGMAETIDICLCGREAFFSGDLPGLSHLRNTRAASYSNSVTYGLERDIEALREAHSEAPLAFISYKHESPTHRDWVRKLGTDLRRNGVNALLDEWEILAGDSISDYMAKGVGRSKFFLLVVSAGVLADLDDSRVNPLKLEIQMAAARRYGGEDIKIIALLRSTDKPPTLLKDNLWVDFRTEEAYASALEKTLESIFGKSKRPPLLPRR